VILASISLPPSPKAVPIFDIEFEVPCSVAVQDVALQSNDTWTLFVMKVSEVMGCLLSHVKLSFTPRCTFPVVRSSGN
jgi:hypothetical protein